jgi:hypothetical protein
MSRTIFLLSPANFMGKRAQYLLRDGAEFELAVRARGAGISVGEAFSFVSGLYFRGKLAYARTFGHAQGAAAGRSGGILVIVPGRGLVSPETVLGLDELRAIRGVAVEPADPVFRDPLARDAVRLREDLRADDRVVLLGSIATDKYAAILQEHLDDRLEFPAAFVGRGDMSRGGLMLRCAREGRELTYERLAGAVRRGSRPPRLGRLAR